jgi:uncharacterized coiled-coil protein SlyX
MKNYFLLSFIALILFVSCDPKNSDEYKQLKAKQDSLERLGLTKDSSIIGFIESFNEIQGNLDSIKQKEGIISLTSQNTQESKAERTAKINEDIKAIYKLVEDNKRKVAALSKKLKGANVKVAELEKMIDNLNKQIVAKDAEIDKLKTDLANMNITVANLSASVDTLSKAKKEQAEKLEAQDKLMKTVYYVVGKKEDLVKLNILDKGGLFSKSKVQAENFKSENFTKIDMTEVTVIELPATKAAKFLTQHPASSYSLTVNKKAAGKLEITDPATFWSISKYLVLQLE